MDIPDFHGSLNPEDLYDWLRTIERFFEFKNYDEHTMYKVAILKLKGYASMWFETLKMTRKKEGKDAIKT